MISQDHINYVITEAQQLVECIACNESVYQATNFSQRLEAAEEIELHVCERLQTLEASCAIDDSSSRTRIAHCLTSARNVLERLESLNHSLINSLRDGIKTGVLRGTTLTKTLLDCVGGKTVKEEAPHTPGYDAIDILVNSVLHAEELPQTEQADDPELVFYQKTPARIVFELCERVELGETSVLADLGSGLGQTALLAHLLSGTSVMAIERDSTMHQYAQRCAAQCNVHAIDFVNADVREADLSRATVVYCYDPCRGATLDQLVGKLRAEAQRRHITIMSYGRCSTVFAREKWLRCEESVISEFALTRFDTLR